MNTTATNVLRAAKNNEQAGLDSVLMQVMPDRSSAALVDIPSRRDTAELYAKDLQTISTDVKKLMEKAAQCRAVHEAERAQRDMEIINAGHKKLLLACMKAAMKRSEKLQREVTAMEMSK